MLDTQTQNSTSNVTSNEHTIDISCWEEVPLTGLNTRQKRRFQKHKAVIKAYFADDAPLDEIARQHDIAKQSVLAMAEKCLMYHADGHIWGFRALLPGTNVVDHTPSEGQRALAIQETSTKHEPDIDDGENDAITARRPAIVITTPVKIPTILSFPETLCLARDKDEPIYERESMTGASPVTTIDEYIPKPRSGGRNSSDRACPCHALC